MRVEERPRTIVMGRGAGCIVLAEGGVGWDNYWACTIRSLGTLIFELIHETTGIFRWLLILVYEFDFIGEHFFILCILLLGKSWESSSFVFSWSSWSLDKGGHVYDHTFLYILSSVREGLRMWSGHENRRVGGGAIISV